MTSPETPDPLTVVFRAREPYYTLLGDLVAIGIIANGTGENQQQPEPGPSRVNVSYWHQLDRKLGLHLRHLRADHPVQDGGELLASTLQACAARKPNQHAVVPALVLELPRRGRNRSPDIHARRERQERMPTTRWRCSLMTIGLPTMAGSDP